MKFVNLLAAAMVASSTAFADPLFPNSVVSNDIDFITTNDPNSFYCMQYFGTDTREMPDKRSDVLFANGVHVFEAWFQDGTAVEITVHPDIGNKTRAAKVAGQLSGPLGRLPSFMRERLSHVIVHKGDETAFAEDQGRFFTVYDANMRKRLSTHDLEETVFHEAVHATMDVPIASDRKWRQAQKKDGAFITEYAARLPKREDLAETALFAFTYFQHPERLDANVTAALEAIAPNRLAFLEQFFGPNKAMQRRAKNLPACNS